MKTRLSDRLSTPTHTQSSHGKLFSTDQLAVFAYKPNAGHSSALVAVGKSWKFYSFVNFCLCSLTFCSKPFSGKCDKKNVKRPIEASIAFRKFRVIERIESSDVVALCFMFTKFLLKLFTMELEELSTKNLGRN